MGDDLELRERVDRFDFDTGALPGYFTEKLAHDNDWELRYAQRVLGEYRRFVMLACTAEHLVVPSVEVDMAWHQHVLDTEQYWGTFCREVLRRPLHHRPDKGGTAGRRLHVDMYRRTLRTYVESFGDHPPPDIWPPAERRFAGGAAPHRIALSDTGSASEHRVRRAGIAVAAAAGLPATVAWADPAGWSHAEIVVVALTAALVAVVASIALRRLLLGRTPGPTDVPTLTDPYEVAVLNTTTQRAVNSAVAALVRDDVLAFDETSLRKKTRGYRLVRTAPMPRSAHPLEQAVYDAVDSAGVGTPLSDVHRRTVPDARRLLNALRERGLLHRGRFGRRLVVTLPIVVVVIAFVILAAAGDEFTIGLLLISAVVLVVTGLGLSAPPPELTAAGLRALDTIRDSRPEYTSVDREDVPNGRELSWVIALTGSPVLRGGSLAVLDEAIMAPAAKGGGGRGVKTAGCGGRQQFGGGGGGGYGGGGGCGGGGGGCGGGCGGG